MLDFSDAWLSTVISEEFTIKEVIENLNKTGLKIALIKGADNKLLGTISDGDIRGAIMKGVSLSELAISISSRAPLVVPTEVHRDTVIKLMYINKVTHIPVVDDSGNLVGLHAWNELVKSPLNNIMVIMAGGRGSRLMPHTQDTPKPMLLVAGKPMLLHIIERASNEGITKFIISTNYLADSIKNYFGDGSQFGVNISYLEEVSPLGTAGALGLIDFITDEPIVVMNGDVITDISLSELIGFHRRHGAVATMAVREHEWQNPYGVILTNGLQITGIEEKPIIRSHINAGVYVIDPVALSFLQKNIAMDMTTLFELLRMNAQPVVAYPMHEPWLDVGRPSDLSLANSTVRSGKK
ncbi:nucleotidyltransferase family protein [Polynucleobacter sp. JS-JIR-5-A7]|uniref:nucleotidyltransferase family protein n=1 Tax=Polynucleobacter sp. JS-JIR-5-A7 TaxID=1758395 RepID=UPI001BFDB70A|nr:nucleotidyltransferase family protein [Polynucleobacter sp. JS-JIR-5-A7]QWE06938.1 nucleotidyltransferase family protein [Polynucleobacter sp. JS-JIR-5-A7]